MSRSSGAPSRSVTASGSHIKLYRLRASAIYVSRIVARALGTDNSMPVP